MKRLTEATPVGDEPAVAISKMVRGDRPGPDVTIAEAIAAVYQAVGYVQKQQSQEQGQGLRYSYAGEAALIAALRPAMIENGITVAIHSIDSIERDTYPIANNRAMNRTMISATVRFTHAPSRTFVDVQAVGEGSDVGDKSAAKALTGAYKYALRQTFCIETGNDPDDTASAPRTARRAQERQAARNQASAATTTERARGALFARLTEVGVDVQDSAAVHKAVGLSCTSASHDRNDPDACHAVKVFTETAPDEAQAFKILLDRLNVRIREHSEAAS